MREKTPKQIVDLLDKYIVGQNEAKKSVAIALYNRYRRAQLPEDVQKDITPKNILMAGPTGVGKTEIARRLADIVDAPFVKVEATKFTEVGYVGRDVESMVRDLANEAVRIVEKEEFVKVESQAIRQANKTLVRLLVPGVKRNNRQNQMQQMQKKLLTRSETKDSAWLKSWTGGFWKTKKSPSKLNKLQRPTQWAT